MAGVRNPSTSARRTKLNSPPFVLIIAANECVPTRMAESQNVFERMREKLPAYDRSIYALITDIYQRGSTHSSQMPPAVGVS